MYVKNIVFKLFCAVLYLQCEVGLIKLVSVASYEDNPCAEFSVNGCIIDEGAVLETVLDITEHECQILCATVYADNCKFFSFDVVSQKCELLAQELDDYIETCQEIAAPPTPNIDECLTYKDPCKVSLQRSCNDANVIFIFYTKIS